MRLYKFRKEYRNPVNKEFYYGWLEFPNPTDLGVRFHNLTKTNLIGLPVTSIPTVLQELNVFEMLFCHIIILIRKNY